MPPHRPRIPFLLKPLSHLLNHFHTFKLWCRVSVAFSRERRGTPMASCSKLSDRRQFLNFLAASPVLAYAGTASGLVYELLSRPLEAQEMSLAPKDAMVIKSVKEALTVMDFDAAARAKLPI